MITKLAVTVHVLQGEREMAQHNKSLGRFDLSDIPSAPRGVPQIEVAFDIDANGILNVSAKDKNTGKENKIVIKSSSGLSDEEVERMVQDAEAHADEDRKLKELAEARNQAEALVHGVKKSLSEVGEDFPADEKSKIEDAVKALEAAIASDDIEAINSKSEELAQASQKLTEQMYQKAGADAAAGEAPEGAEAAPADDDVVDAEFEEVDDKKDNS